MEVAGRTGQQVLAAGGKAHTKATPHNDHRAARQLLWSSDRLDLFGSFWRQETCTAAIETKVLARTLELSAAKDNRKRRQFSAAGLVQTTSTIKGSFSIFDAKYGDKFMLMRCAQHILHGSPMSVAGALRTVFVSGLFVCLVLTGGFMSLSTSTEYTTSLMYCHQNALAHIKGSTTAYVESSDAQHYHTGDDYIPHFAWAPAPTTCSGVDGSGSESSDGDAGACGCSARCQEFAAAVYSVSFNFNATGNATLPSFPVMGFVAYYDYGDDCQCSFFNGTIASLYPVAQCLVRQPVETEIGGEEGGVLPIATFKFYGNRIIDLQTWDVQLLKIICTATFPAAFVVIAVLRVFTGMGTLTIWDMIEEIFAAGIMLSAPFVYMYMQEYEYTGTIGIDENFYPEVATAAAEGTQTAVFFPAVEASNGTAAVPAGFKHGRWPVKDLTKMHVPLGSSRWAMMMALVYVIVFACILLLPVVLNSCSRIFHKGWRFTVGWYREFE